MPWFSLSLLSLLFAGASAFAQPEAPLEAPPVGIGAGLRQDPATLEIIFNLIIPGAPAEQAGLREQDRLLQVDGLPAIGQPLPDVITRIRGEIGTPVTLLVRRPGEANPLQIVIIRSLFLSPDP